MFNKIFLLIIISLFLSTLSIANEKVFIITTVEDQIITNHDINKESDYLRILNPKIGELTEKQIQNVAKNSLINEIVKKNEINKIFDMNKDNAYVKEYIKNLYTRLNFNNEADFKKYLISSSSYSFEEIKKKIKIEILWNELIYSRYGDQISINKKKLLKKINNLNNQIRTEYKLSEIVFKKKKEIKLDDQINKIKISINNIGFDNTANIYSISESSKMGGDIGWINENNLSEKIFSNIKDLKENEFTDTIQIGNNYLLLKVNEIRQKNIPINKEEELEKMIKFETNKQLNQFSKIFFDKAKINYSINER
ncbi:MAG: peptidylprolyl isomerase [Candidatus Pelagibacter sp.]